MPIQHPQSWSTTATLSTLVVATLFSLAADAQKQPAPSISTVAGNGTSGYVTMQDGGLATRAQLAEPYGTALDRAGNLYIADRANNRVRRVEAATGIITTVAGDGIPGYNAAQDGGPASRAQLNGPRAVALDDAGNLYIADTQNHIIRKVVPTGVITTIAGTGVAGYRSAQEGGPANHAQLDSPRGLAVDHAGNIYVTDYNNGRIRRIDAATGSIATVAGTGDAGYVASQEGGPATRAELNRPDGVAVDTQGNLYIADAGNHRIRKVDALSNTIMTVAGDGAAGYKPRDEGAPSTRASLNEPRGIAVDGVGNLYIADFENSRVRMVSAATHAITTLAGNGIAGYMASQDGGTAASARINKPCGVAVDRSGNVYIADYNNNRVRKIAAVRPGLDIAGN